VSQTLGEIKIKFKFMTSMFRIILGIVLGFAFIIFLLFIINSGGSFFPKSNIGGGYYKNFSGIYIDNAWGRGFDIGKHKIDTADKKSFKYLGGHYAIDDNSAYYLDEPFRVDKSTFTALNNNYAKDLSSAYFHSKKIIADAKSFETINNEIGQIPDVYAKDDQNVFFNGKKLDNSDSSTFKIIAGEFHIYSKDKQQTYLDDKIISNTGSETFEVLIYPFARDINNVYCIGNIIKKANPKTFKVLNKHYSRDDQNVYYSNWEYSVYSTKIINGADAQTFEVIDESNAKDKNNVYSEDKKQGR